MVCVGVWSKTLGCVNDTPYPCVSVCERVETTVYLLAATKFLSLPPLPTLCWPLLLLTWFQSDATWALFCRSASSCALTSSSDRSCRLRDTGAHMGVC